MAKEEYVAPPDPDFDALAQAGFDAWERDRPKLVAFDTETSGFGWNDDAFCVTVAWPGPHGDEVHYFELGDVYRAQRVRMILQHAARGGRLIGHNIKFDLHRALNQGLLDRDDLRPINIGDTEALAHLDDEHRPKALKSLAVSVLGVDDTIEVEVKSGPNKGQTKRVPREKHELDAVRRKLKLKKEDGFHLLPRAVILPYALKDAEFTLQLYRELAPRVRRYDDLTRLYRQEMELTLVFVDMEARGLGVREDYVAEKVAEYSKRVFAIEDRIAGIVGREVVSALLPRGKPKDEEGKFNPSSNPQLREFFEAAGHVHESYDAAVLERLNHPLAGALLDLRSDLKIRNTYLLALQNGTVDGIFHPSVRQHGTVTGRTSSGAEKADR